MNFSGPKQLIHFILACFLAAVLVIFGFYLLSLTRHHFTPTEFFIFGIVLVLGGVFVITAQAIQEKTRLLLGSVLILTGFYQFGRASGVIKVAWLAYFAGIACFVAAGLVGYIARPRSPAKSPKERADGT